MISDVQQTAGQCNDVYSSGGYCPARQLRQLRVYGLRCNSVEAMEFIPRVVGRDKSLVYLKRVRTASDQVGDRPEITCNQIAIACRGWDTVYEHWQLLGDRQWPWGDPRET